MRNFARQYALGFLEAQKDGPGSRLSDEKAMDVAREAQDVARRKLRRAKTRPKRSRKK
jgi:hypothetical protein